MFEINISGKTYMQKQEQRPVKDANIGIVPSFDSTSFVDLWRETSKTKSSVGHVKGHQELSIYPQCELCGLQFDTIDIFRKHCMTHRPEKFVCNVCQRTFKYQSNLKRHMRDHLGDKRHKCKFCGESFTRSDKLGSHIVRVHPETVDLRIFE